MRRSAWWVSPLIALVLTCSPVLVEKAAAGEGGAKKAKKGAAKADRPEKGKAPKGEYAIMAKVLEMDAAQTAKLNEAVESSGKALKAWDEGDNGRKLKELSEEAKKAREAKDKEKGKSLSDQMKPLQKERDELAAAQKAQVMAVLTDEQKAKWAGFTLYRSTIGRYKKVNPTDDQDKQIREMCAEAAKGMPDSSDKKAYSAATKKLNGDIEQKVLTDAQREELKKKPAGGDKAAKPAKEKAAGGKKKGGNQPVIVE